MRYFAPDWASVSSSGTSNGSLSYASPGDASVLVTASWPIVSSLNTGVGWNMSFSLRNRRSSFNIAEMTGSLCQLKGISLGSIVVKSQHFRGSYTGDCLSVQGLYSTRTTEKTRQTPTNETRVPGVPFPCLWQLLPQDRREASSILKHAVVDGKGAPAA